MTAIALTIAGSDSSGGAGIQADLKTFSALGVYGASVITALTAQNTQGVSGIHDVPADFVAAQLDAVLSDLDVKAVKIGMLPNAEIIRVISEKLKQYRCANIILDPVMVATSGDVLVGDSAVEALQDTLFQQADLITPNLHEAAFLTGRVLADNDQEMEFQARLLVERGTRAVLLKGGHSDGNEARDLLIKEDQVNWFTGKRHQTTNTHGTGCTLSSAIAAECAKGDLLSHAIGSAKSYVNNSIKNANMLTIGQGHGPVHHFHDLWKET